MEYPRASKMKFNLILNFTLYSLLGYSEAFAGSSCCGVDITSCSYPERLLENYIAVWGGNLSPIDTVFHPDVVLFADNFPSETGKGSSATHIKNRDEFAAFVRRSRTGWKEYYFEPIRTVAADHSVAVRWIMHGVLVSNFTLFPTPLKEGAAVTYNGTDFLVQDDCTGQIREAYIAGDIIPYFHVMGLDGVTV